MFLKQNVYAAFSANTDIFTQKCNKIVTKISSHQEKQKYKQTYILVVISL